MKRRAPARIRKRAAFFGLALALASATLVVSVTAAVLGDEARPLPRNASATQPSGIELAPLTADELNAGIVRLAVALRPTATPIPTPTPAPPPAGQASAAAVEPSGPEVCAASMDGLALPVFNAMNAERARQGLSSLIAHSCATYVARKRSLDMAQLGYLSHSGSEGETWSSLLGSYGVSYAWAGENIARNSYKGVDAASTAMVAFMTSPGHRENILNANFTHVGVAAVTDAAGVTYFTVTFLGF